MIAVNHTTLFGGAERNLQDLLSRLPESQIRTLALVAPGNGLTVSMMREVGVRCLDLPVPHFANVRSPSAFYREYSKWKDFRRAFAALVSREAPDVIYASSPHAAIAIAPVLARAGVPWVWQMPDLVRNRYINRWALRTAFRSARAIMAISRATEKSLVQLGADRSKIRLVYCAVEAEQFNLPSSTRVRFRADHGISTSAPLIGMFGQLTSWKGWHVLVESIPQVRAAFPNAKFVFVGGTMSEADHVYESNLKGRLAELGVDQSVIWTGFLESVAQVMVACDVVVHASIRPEPLGVVVMEGMAACKPVICTQGGGTAEMVRDGETGFVIEANSSTALARAIMTLLADPVLQEQMGAKGRREVESRFTHERRVSAFLNVFREVVAANQRVS